jgi:hypothetical protein
MSILLESLSGKHKQQTSAEEPLQVPDISVAHYDDELLGDEWLIRRVKFWQRLSFALALVLLISWSYFGFNSFTHQPQLTVTQPVDTDDNNQAALNANQLATQGGLNQQTQPVVPNQSPALVAPTKQTQLKPNERIATSHKQVYTPQKQASSKPQSKSQSKPEDLNVNDKAVNAKTKKSGKLNTPIFRDELPVELQAELPELKVDSFVVADNQKDSFVILDGAFYTVNQVIAPQLILRDIQAQHLIVEFKSYLVKISYQ